MNQLRKVMAEMDGSDYLFRTVTVIANWPDFRFQTNDGREYGLFLDGKSIELRLDAKCELQTPAGRERLRGIAGFILELSDDKAEPMIFADLEALASEWLALHVSHGIKLGDERDLYDSMGWDTDENGGD